MQKSSRWRVFVHQNCKKSRGGARDDAGAQTTVVCCELFTFAAISCTVGMEIARRFRDQVAQHDAGVHVRIQAGPARGNVAARVFPDEQPGDASRLQKSGESRYANLVVFAVQHPEAV